MKHQIRRITALLMVLLLQMFLFASASAATVTRNDLQLDFSTDKDSYSIGDSIQCTVDLTNNGQQELTVSYDIVLPEGLTDLGMGVFYYCTPKSVYLPSTLSSVGDGFMAGCGGEYIVSPDHELIRSTDGIIISQSGSVFYAFPYDRTGTYTLPKTVTKIFGGAFYGCQLSKIIVPESVTIIDDRAFLHCADLKTIVLPKGLQEIGARAFMSTGLTEITIPYSCKTASDSFDETLTVKYFS